METLIEHTRLENGATLELCDASRTMIGDRMLVCLVARVKIPVESLEEDGADYSLPPAGRIRQALGDPVTWQHTRQRKFIDSLEKDEVLGLLQKDFNANMRPYIRHPGFPAGYVKKRLKDAGVPAE